MELPPVKHPRPYQRICPHCSEIVSYKTFRSHKRLYYDRDSGTWLGANIDIDPSDVSGEARDLVLNCSSESSPSSSPMIDQDDFSAHEGSPPHSDPAVSPSSDLSSPSEPGQ